MSSPSELARHLAAALADPARLASFARDVAPSRDRLERALAPSAPLDVLAAAYGGALPPPTAPDPEWARVLKVPSDRTEVEAFAATGAQIAERASGGSADRHFPGGSQRIAPMLQPDRTYVELTCTAPGASSGTRFHLFTHLDDGWCMLGPLWRFAPK